MRTPLALALFALFSVSAFPQPATAIREPSSLTIRAGYVAAQPAAGGIHSVAPSLVSSWDVGSRAAIWASIGYIQEQPNRVDFRDQLGFTNSGVLWPRPRVVQARTHLVPMSAGVRFYPKEGARAPRGPYVELAPTAYLARYRDREETSHSAVLGGLQAGLGLRFAAFGSSRGEIGASYFLAEALGSPSKALGRLGTAGEVDYSLFSVYVAIGLGD